MSALETELARATAKHSLPATKSNRQDGEVVATSTARATVLVGGQAHTVSTNTLPRDVADGDTVTVEWGSAIPSAVAVRTPGSSVAPAGVPTGVIVDWGGYFNSSPVPTGWLDCDGSAISRTTYADLFDVLGTTAGAGNGYTTFNIPDADGYIIKT